MAHTSFTQITGSGGEVEMGRLEGFAGEVARKILSSADAAQRPGLESRVYEDLAYMVREVLLSDLAASSQPARSESRR